MSVKGLRLLNLANQPAGDAIWSADSWFPSSSLEFPLNRAWLWDTTPSETRKKNKSVDLPSQLTENSNVSTATWLTKNRHSATREQWGLKTITVAKYAIFSPLSVPRLTDWVDVPCLLNQSILLSDDTPEISQLSPEWNVHPCWISANTNQWNLWWDHFWGQIKSISPRWQRYRLWNRQFVLYRVFKSLQHIIQLPDHWCLQRLPAFIIQRQLLKMIITFVIKASALFSIFLKRDSKKMQGKRLKHSTPLIQTNLRVQELHKWKLATRNGGSTEPVVRAVECSPPHCERCWFPCEVLSLSERIFPARRNTFGEKQASRHNAMCPFSEASPSNYSSPQCVSSTPEMVLMLFHLRWHREPRHFIFLSVVRYPDCPDMTTSHSPSIVCTFPWLPQHQ